MQMNSFVLTPVGTGGVGVIHIVGCDDLALLERELVIKTRQQSRDKIYYGLLYQDKSQPDSLIDEVLIHTFSGSDSLSGLPTLEINCHGGVAVIEAIISMLENKGICRKDTDCYPLIHHSRNQRIALQHLLHASTEFSAKVFTYQINGALETEIKDIINKIDNQQWEIAEHKLSELCASAELGKALVLPKTIVIAGKPNAGKSTLINRLLGRERMIVDRIPGTTRDAISILISIQGIPFYITDTAGIRETDNPIELLGINATHQALQKADNILWLIDSTEPPTPTPITTPNTIVCLNKADANGNYLKQYQQLFPQAIAISALTGQNITALENYFSEKFKKWIDSQQFAVILDPAILEIAEQAKIQTQRQQVQALITLEQLL